MVATIRLLNHDEFDYQMERRGSQRLSGQISDITPHDARTCTLRIAQFNDRTLLMDFFSVTVSLDPTQHTPSFFQKDQKVIIEYISNNTTRIAESIYTTDTHLIMSSL